MTHTDSGYPLCVKNCVSVVSLHGVKRSVFDIVTAVAVQPVTPMVYLTGAPCEARGKQASPDGMFDATAWRIRHIWEGVRLEVAGDASPVVLHSFTQLDPDLPLLEVTKMPQIQRHLHLCF